MDRIDELRIFARVVECASFTQAAESLRLPRSSVSTAVRALETRLGTRLMHRTTRRVALTSDGQAFYERCAGLLDDFDEVQSLFRQEAASPGGRLRVTVPSRLGRLAIIPALPGFLRAYPNVDLELSSTDRVVDLLREGYDGALRVGPRHDSGAPFQVLGDIAIVNCASPAYLARFGVPATIDDVRDHLAVGYASPASGRVEQWEYRLAGRPQTVPIRRQITVESAEDYIACGLAGLGLIQVPAFDVHEHLARGELVEVLGDLRPEPMRVSFVYPERRPRPGRLVLFVEWLRQLLAPSLLPEAGGGGDRR